MLKIRGFAEYSTAIFGTPYLIPFSATLTALDIEIDGKYYHKEWDGSRCREDFIRDLRLQALGWHVKRFWVYQIRDQQGKCVQEVLDLIKSINK